MSEDNSIKVSSKDYFFTLYLPVEYFNDDASDEVRAVVDHFRKVLNQASQGLIQAISLPSVFDDCGNRVFELVVTPKVIAIVNENLKED